MSNLDPRNELPPDPLAVVLPRATRFRKNIVWGSLGVAGVALAGVVAYGFLHSPPSPTERKPDTQSTSNQKPQHPDLASFPVDYSQIKPVQTGPVVVSAPPAAAPVSAGRVAAQPTELDKAHASNVFFAQSVTPRPETTVAPVASSFQPLQPQVYGSAPIPAEGQGGLTVQKNTFLSNAGAIRDYVAKPLQPPISPYEIKAGTVISAALVTGVNSDLPGEIVAQVTDNVYDTATGHSLLVPQGSRLVGKYDSLLSYGQNRALVVWNRLILPNGDSIDLEGMPGSDQTGAAGLEDQTNHHRWQFAGALAVSTLLSLGPSVATALAESGHSGSDTNIYTAPASALSGNTSQVGENLLNRELNRPNTITVRPGWPLNVLINRDLVMRSYTNG